MYISMNWIQEFVDLSGIDLMALIHQFSLSTAEVENTVPAATVPVQATFHLKEHCHKAP